MAIQQMHHVSVVVDDLEGAVAFFAALGMDEEGRAPIEGPWVDRINALDGVKVDIVMMRTPDGHGRLELTKFHAPEVISPQPANALGNTLGLRSLMFAVDDLDATLTGLRPHGAELVGEIEQYEDIYRLCYVRGPAGVIVSLSEDLR
jgi:catechol 2,3-dioxygenase-like lactoylglutathione lyase family enzyme